MNITGALAARGWTEGSTMLNTVYPMNNDAFVDGGIIGDGYGLGKGSTAKLRKIDFNASRSWTEYHSTNKMMQYLYLKLYMI